MHDLAPRLTDLGALLAAHRDVWAPRPFRGEALPWVDRHPALATWCRARTPDEIVALEDRLDALPLPTPLGGWWAEAEALTTLPALDAPPLPHDHAAALGMPGRKWTQLRRLGGVAAPAARASGTVLDWCAGKAHLGRTLARHTGARLVAVERDAELVAAGRDLAERAGVAADLRTADVMQADLTRLARGATLVALHACGALGHAALARAVADGAHTVVLAPCCHHRVPPGPWTARSAAGRAAGLALDRDHLRLACADASCSGRRRRVFRERELAWRQGLDLLRAQATGVPAYRPLPSCPRGWLMHGFAAWVERMAEAHAVPLPARWDPDVWEARGRARAWELRALGMPRLAFRRALEVWLLLDRARWLQEQGWRPRVGTFCRRDVTPRNLCIVANPG